MIQNAVKFSTGYIQIHKKGYWENKSISETFLYKNAIDSVVSKNKNINFSLPRIESYALASSGKHTKGSFVIGTDPELEDELNNYSEKVVEGEYLSSNDKAVLLGDKLAEYLNIGVNDTLVMLGQGYHGITAAAQYPVKGIIHFPLPDLNKQLVVMPLAEAQYYYATENRLTSLSLMLEDAENIDETKRFLENNLSDEYEVMTWDEMNREMVQAIESDNIGGIFMLGILYTVIGFGVFGTIMMMTMERKKEFAVLVSVGMQKSKLLLVVVFETILIGMVAVILGLLVSYPVLLYLYHNPIPLTGDLAVSMEIFGVEPILPFSVKPGIFFNQALTVIGIAIVAVLYPLSVILRFDVMKALRS
jgi:ABC-type lipoprotein release transport system permease subunit